MEIDFSEKIIQHNAAVNLQNSTGRSGPKSAAQTPALKSERRKGSSKNRPGSAAKDGKAIEFSAKVVEALKNKVKEHNAKYSRKVSLGQLKKVYRRGAGAFSTSHRPGKTRGQWAMARVNTFLRMMAGKPVKDSYRKADSDISRAFEIDFIGDLISTDEDFSAADEDILMYNLNYDFLDEQELDLDEADQELL